MNLVKHTPFRDFENFMTNWHLPWAHEGMDFSKEMIWQPSVDITESDKEFLIKVELPEVRKEDLNIEVEGGVLSIKGERREEMEDKKRHRIERFYGNFERSFTIPENVREDGVNARLDGGMLYIHLAKTEIPPNARKHQVKVS